MQNFAASVILQSTLLMKRYFMVQSLIYSWLALNLISLFSNNVSCITEGKIFLENLPILMKYEMCMDCKKEHTDQKSCLEEEFLEPVSQEAAVCTLSWTECNLQSVSGTLQKNSSNKEEGDKLTRLLLAVEFLRLLLSCFPSIATSKFPLECCEKNIQVDSQQN